MVRFGIENIDDLRSYLYTANIHDGEFLQAAYDQITKIFVADIENVIWGGYRYVITFSDVLLFMTVSDYKWGENESINGLYVLNGKKELPDCMSIIDCENYLCFAFELFSGNYIYIVCSEIAIRNEKG